MKIIVTKYVEPAQELDVDRIDIDQGGEGLALVITDANNTGILVQAFDRMDIRPRTENSVVITAF